MQIDDLIGKGIYLFFKSANGDKTLVGLLSDFDGTFLTVKSRGNEYTINMSQILEIREARGRVEP